MKEFQVKNFMLFLLSMYLVLSPFYLWSSGVPQIGDFFLVLIMGFYILYYKIEKNIILLISSLMLFYIFFVNAFYSILSSNILMNINTIYFIFNITILLMFINLYKYFGKKLLSFLKYGVLISLVIQFTLSFIMENNGRTTIFFNNPNQLGYYALLNLSFIILIYFIGKMSVSTLIIFSSISYYLILLSLSSAAILASSFLLICSFLILFLKNNTKKLKYKLVVLILVAFFISNLDMLSKSQLFINTEERFLSKAYSLDENINERRLNIVLENKKFWIFGSGQGSMDRFGSNLEIHSSFPSFFFYYGIIGLCLLIILFILLIKRPSFITISILLSIHLYGLTHQGLREPSFWILLAFIYIVNKHNLEKNF